MTLFTYRRYFSRCNFIISCYPLLDEGTTNLIWKSGPSQFFSPNVTSPSAKLSVEVHGENMYQLTQVHCCSRCEVEIERLSCGHGERVDVDRCAFDRVGHIVEGGDCTSTSRRRSVSQRRDHKGDNGSCEDVEHDCTVASVSLRVGGPGMTSTSFYTWIQLSGML